MVQPSNVSDEDLIAFLDGEASPELDALIRIQLTADPSLRQRLRSLEASWELLDILPHESPNTKVVATTLELATIDVARSNEHKSNWLGTKRYWLLFSSGVLACSLLGGIIGTSISQYKNDQFMKELAILVSLSELQHVDSLGHLERLTKLEPLMRSAIPPDADKATLLALPESISGRKEWLEKLPADKKVIIADNFAKWEALPNEQKTLIRNVSTRLSPNAPNAQTYQLALRNYDSILSRIGTTEQAELQSIQEMDKRIEMLIGIVQRELAFAYAQELTGKDRRAIRDWTSHVQDEIVKDASAEWSSQFQENLFKLLGGFESVGEQIGYPLINDGIESFVTDSEFDRLLPELSKKAQELLKPLSKQWQRDAVGIWTLYAVDRSPPMEQNSAELRRKFSELVAERQATIELLPERDARRALTPQWFF